MHTLKSLRRFIGRRGILAVPGLLLTYLFWVPVSLLRLRCLPAFRSPQEIFDYSVRGCGGIFAPFQLRSEFVLLLERLQRSLPPPRTVLEIGTATGGTLFAFTRVATEDAVIVSVDLPEGMYGGGYPSWKVPLYRSFRRRVQRLFLFRADSHSDAAMKQVKDALGSKPLDFLFIDGDHSYDGVKKDFLQYGGLVRPGGLVALHDIVPNSADSTFGVADFWREVRARFDVEEYIDNPSQCGAGIGCVRVPDTGISSACFE